MKKSILNFSILKNSSSNLFSRQFFYSRTVKNSSAIHDPHMHGEGAQNDYHGRKYNRISYNKKLSGPERDKIPFIDYMNEPEVEWLNPRRNKLFVGKRYEVLVPFNSRRDDMEDSLMDRTEIKARIYDILRQMDLKPLDEIDFYGDYEKDLGFDSLEWTALVTSIEHEFHTVFEDSLFEHYRTINQFVEHIEKDFSSF